MTHPQRNKMKSVEEKAKDCVGGCTCDFERGFAWKGEHLETCIVKRVAKALADHAQEAIAHYKVQIKEMK